MSKDMPLKNKEKFDFFTTTKIYFPYENKEYLVELNVCGNFQKSGEKLIPVQKKYTVEKIVYQDRRIKPSEKMLKHIDKWIKNNPNKFVKFVVEDLDILASAIAIPSKKSIDKVKVI